MELLQLQYFYESATTENFAKTAEKHFVPTSSVSGAVRRLEKELGCPLFDRTSNRLTLNNNGKLLQQALQVAFHAVEQAVDQLSQTRERPLQVLVRIPADSLIRQIAAFHLAFPQIRLQLDCGTEALPPEHYDVILDRQADLYPARDAAPLCHLQLRLTASPDHPLSQKKVALAQLAGEVFILPKDSTPAHREFLAACRKAGFCPIIGAQSNDPAVCRQLVCAGAGIGAEYIYGETPPQGLVLLETPELAEPSAVYAFCKKDGHKQIAQLLEFLRG